LRLGLDLNPLIPRRYAAAPGGAGERIPPMRFAHPLLSAFGLRKNYTVFYRHGVALCTDLNLPILRRFEIIFRLRMRGF